jgi:hypothetical protein
MFPSMAHQVLEIGEMLNTPHRTLSRAHHVPLLAQLSLHVTTLGLPFITVCKTFHCRWRPFYHLFCIPPLAVDIKCFTFRKLQLFYIFNLYTKNKHWARIGFRLQAWTWFSGVSAIVECSFILQHFELVVHLVATWVREIHWNHINFCGEYTRITLGLQWGVYREVTYFCIKGERCLNNCNTICKLLFALFRFKVYIMQTLMELIETCINKEPNANLSDVSPNAVIFVSYCLHYWDLRFI